MNAHVAAMSEVIYDDPSIVANFVHTVIHGVEGNFGPCTTIAFLDDKGVLEAGVVFHNYQPSYGTIEISGAGTRSWLTLHKIKTILSYPFFQLGCQMVVIQTHEDNDLVQKMAKLVGATEYRIRRMRGPDKDAFIYTLTKEDWVNSRFMR